MWRVGGSVGESRKKIGGVPSYLSLTSGAYESLFPFDAAVFEKGGWVLQESEAEGGWVN